MRHPRLFEAAMASDATNMALKYAHGHGYRVINVSDFKFDVKFEYSGAKERRQT